MTTKQAISSPYAMRQCRIAYVEVLGKLWMPMATAGTRYELSDYDLENIGEFTRENVDDWLGTHAGDFSSVKDFAAVCGETVIPWSSEDNELEFSDCMYPSEDFAPGEWKAQYD
jgi:hypothetical protein